MKKITLFSPAKINLFFRVLNKRKDGYHDIASLIQAISFGDTLSISLKEESSSTFSCNEETLVFDEKNLIYKAIELFKKNTHLRFNVDINLDKQIPMQAGLGGGSSNAATTLYALNKLLKTDLSDAVLAEWGSSLGADVPCFFSLGRVFCEGIGEKLTLIEERKESYWIAKPRNLDLSTPSVYEQCNPLQSSTLDPKGLLEAFQNKQISFINDLEKAAFSLLPTLKSFKQSCFDLGFKYVMMTGSGTAFICIGDVINPSLPNTVFIKGSSLSRESDHWYNCS